MALNRTPATVLRTLAVVCLAVAAGLCVATGWGPARLELVPLVALAVAAAELAAQSQPSRLRRLSSLTEGVVAAALVVAPGAWSVLAVGIGVALAQRARRSPRLHREHDLGRRVLAMALAQAVAGALGGGVLGACAGTAVFWLASCALLAVAVSAASGRPVRSLLGSRAPLSALHACATASAGVLTAHLALEAPWGLLGLAVPAAVLGATSDQRSRSGGEARLFAELARDSGRTQDSSAQRLVTAAARLLGGADVELVVLTADGPVCFTGDEAGRPSRRSTGLDEPWVLTALAGGRLSHGREQGRPYLCAVLGSPDRPVAVLRARRGTQAPAFDRSEQSLCEVLARQAEAWLREPAGTTAVGVDETASEALDAVRASAQRLAELAAGATSVPDVVQELHDLERAVVSLVGARVLAGSATSTPGGVPGPAPAWPGAPTRSLQSSSLSGVPAVPQQRTATGPVAAAVRAVPQQRADTDRTTSGVPALPQQRTGTDRSALAAAAVPPQRADTDWTTTGVLR